MNVHTTFQASPDDMRAMLAEAVRPLADELQALRAQIAHQKHAYTIREVAEKIGYSADTVRGFIREGRAGRNSKRIKLKALEITAGDYRITPKDLDAFIAQF